MKRSTHVFAFLPLVFCTMVVISGFEKSCKAEIDEEAVIQVLKTYNGAIIVDDIDKAISCWAKETYTAHINMVNKYFMGWETIKKDFLETKEKISKNPQKPGIVTLQDTQVDIHNGKTAHVKSQWSWSGVQEGERIQGTYSVFTILEKYDNTWKIVLQVYPEHKVEYPDRKEFEESEDDINKLGYKLLGKKDYARAIEVFKLNAKLYPESANVYDSLGEAYMKNGDIALAIKNYKKAHDLNPKNKNVVNLIKEMEKSR
jgi:hypothetical protein